MPSMTFVGLGNMGAALARTQVQSGAEITVWNRTRDKKEVDELVSLGATFSPSLHAALRASSLVVFCVLDYATLYKVLEAERAARLDSELLRGKTVINLTNGTPKDARVMDAWMRSRGVLAYLDGGVMAGPDTVGTQQCFVLYSGADHETFYALKSTLQVWGRAEYYGKDPGAAALTDLALLAGWYGMLQGAMVGISLLRKQQHAMDASRSGRVDGGADADADGGTDDKNEESGPIERQVESLLNPFLQSFMASHVRIARAIEHNDFAAHGHPMDMQSVAMQNVARGCEEEGVDTGVFKHFFGLVQKRVEEGGGKAGIASLLDQLVQEKP